MKSRTGTQKTKMTMDCSPVNHDDYAVDQQVSMDIDSISIEHFQYVPPHRCHSEMHKNMNSSHHHFGNPTTELLVDWPRPKSSGDYWRVNADDHCRAPSKKSLYPRVTFSKISSVQVYPHDPMDVRDMSYTKDERKKFCAEAVSECLRIRKLLQSTPGGFSKDSFKCLIKNNVISMEDIVGIDHMVLGKSASMLKERQEHVRSVVSAQQDLSHGDSMEKLAAFCSSRSMRAVRRARVRAALACPRKEKKAGTEADDAAHWAATKDSPRYSSLQERENYHARQQGAEMSSSRDRTMEKKFNAISSSSPSARRPSSTSSSRARIHAALAA